MPTPSRPAIPAVADFWYDEFKVTQPGDDQRGWPFLLMVGAMGAAFGRMFDLVRDTFAGLGWSVVLDPSRTDRRDLEWLSQFAGSRARVQKATNDSDKRLLITSPPSFLRCTVTGMRAAVQATLVGTKDVRIVERTGNDPYAITVIVRPSETPDPAASLAAAMSQKPLGTLLSFLMVDSPLIDEGTRDIDLVPSTIETTTIGDIT